MERNPSTSPTGKRHGDPVSPSDVTSCHDDFVARQRMVTTRRAHGRSGPSLIGAELLMTLLIGA